MTDQLKSWIEQNEAKNEAAKIMADAIEAARKELETAGVDKSEAGDILDEIYRAETE